MAVHHFDCRLYVPPSGAITISLPAETGPRRLIKLLPLDYDQLFDPGLRRLLAAFESVPRPSSIVQV